MSFGLQRVEITRGKGNETVGFVIDVVFEVEVVLLERELGG